jgi:hypothetical protein
MDEFDDVGDSSYLPTPIQEGNLVSPIQEGTLVSRKDEPREYDFPTVPHKKVLTQKEKEEVRKEKEAIIVEQIPLLKKMFPESKFLFLFKDIASNIKNVPMDDIDKFIDALTLFVSEQDTEFKKILVRRMHSALSNTLKGGKSKRKKTKTQKGKRRKTRKL